MNYCIVKDGIIKNIIVCADDKTAKKFGAVPSYDGAMIGGEYSPPPPVEPKPIAPRNIVEGECVSIDGVLYLATENIPNGEPVIVGQNAVITTIEEQLHELKGE